MKKFLINIVLLAVMAAGSKLAAQTNLIMNPGFTAGGANWDFLATGTLETNLETSYGGSDGTNIVTEIDFNSIPNQQITGFEIGKRYRLAFKATRRTNSLLTPLSVPVRVTVDLDGAGGGSVLNQVFSKSNIVFSYETLTYEFVAAATTYVLKFDAQFSTSAGLILDDVVVTADAPGGQLNGLSLWLKADAGVTTAAGSAVTAWQDSSRGGNDAAQGAAGRRPERVDNGLNFNPVLDFDGNDDYLLGMAGFYSDDYFLVVVPDNPVSNASAAQYPFTGYNSQPDDITGIGFGGHTNRFTDEVIASNVGSSSIYGVGQTSAALSYSGPLLINSKHNGGGTAFELFVDGAQIDNTSAGSYTTFNDLNYKVGAVDLNGDDMIVAGDVFAGRIAEVIVYDTRNDLTGRQKIQSYLALKYGITLDQSSAQDYLASNSTVVYPATGTHNSYDNNIAGIGRDDHSQLNQTKSASINTDALVTIALGNDFDSPGSFLGDNTFLVWGRDSGNSTDVVVDTVAGTDYERLARVWRVFETNSPGDVSLEFDINGLEYNAAQIFLLLDDDGDFSDATLHSTGRAINANSVRFTNVDFNNSTNQYFALALQRNPLVNLSVSVGSIAEIGGSASVTALLVDPADGLTAQVSNLGVTAQLDYSNGTATGPGASDDFNAANSIAVAVGTASNNIVVTAIDDVTVEIGETVVIDIDSVANASENGSQQISIAINDDDDMVMPDIESINRQNPIAALTNVDSVSFRVTFSEAVVNVDSSDFTLTTGGTVSASINSVTPVSASAYDVVVNAITGDGSLGLAIAGGHNIADPSGNVFSGTISLEQSYSIDNTVPMAPAVSSPANGALLNDNTPAFSGSGAGSGDSIQVDGPGASDCNVVVDGSGDWSCVLAAPLADGGPYSVTVGATDLAGNTSGGTVVSLSIDTMAPDAPTVDSPANGAVLSDTTPSFSGSGADSGDSIAVVGAGSSCNATVNIGGSWSCTLSPALAEGGPYAINVTAADPASNTSAATAVSLSIDISAPSAPGVDSPANGALLNDNTPAFSGSGAGSGDSIQVDGPGASDCNVVVDGSGDWSCVLAASLADGGPYSVTITATDLAGNTSGGTVVSLSIDTMAPDAPTVDSPTNGAVLSDTTPSFSGSGADSGDSIAVVGAGSSCNATVNVGGGWSCALSPALVDGGPYNVTVTATDLAGNTSGGTVVSLSIDTMAPNAPTVDSPTNGATLADTTPLFSGSGADSGDSIAVVGAGSSCNATVNVGGGWSCALSPALVDGGPYNVTVTATDLAGNTSGGTVVSLSIDTMAPNAPTVDSPTNGATLADTTPLFSGSGADSGDSIAAVGAGSSCNATVNVGGGWSCALSPALVDGGPYNVTVTATDLAGNTSGGTVVSLSIDTMAPNAPTVDSPTNGATLADTTPLFSGSGADSGDSIAAVGAGSSCNATVNIGGSWSCTLSPALAEGGPYTVNVTATDSASNTSVATVVSLSIDTSAPSSPSVDSPANGALLNDNTPAVIGSGANPGDTITVDGPGASDCNIVVGGGGDWSCTLSAALSDGGPYVLSVTAFDGVNTSSATNLSITIDTVAPSAPTVANPGNGALLNDNMPTVSGTGANSGDTININGPGGSDCSVVVNSSGNWGCALVSALADGGPYNLIVTATDPAGNTSSNTVVSISIDTMAPAAPVVSAPVNGATLNIAAPQFTGVGATTGDNIQVSGVASSCSVLVGAGGNWSCTLSPALVEGGPYTFNVTATDPAGNTSAATLVAISIDGAAPVSGEGLTAIAEGAYSIALNWNAASDGLTPVNLLQYQVFYSNAPNLTTLVDVLAATPANAPSAALTDLIVHNLSSSTTYYFNVVVIDEAGNQAIYTMTSAATPDYSVRDSDGDGVPDDIEIQNGTNPNDPDDITVGGDSDSDDDGILDGLEFLLSGGSTTAIDLNTDSDVDGIPDIYELSYGQLSDVFGSDAAANNAPVLTVQSTLTSEATDWFTFFADYQSPSATDSEDGNIAVTGRLHARHGQFLGIDATDVSEGYRYESGTHIVIWSARDSSSKVGVALQTLNILPQVNFMIDQYASVGDSVVLTAEIMGHAPTGQAVQVPFSVDLSDSGGSYNPLPVSGTLTISAGNNRASSTSFTVDTVAQEGEFIVFQMGEPTNAVLGVQTEHRVVSRLNTIQPAVRMAPAQGIEIVRSVASNGGMLQVTASSTHAGTAYNWGESDNALLAAVSGSTTASALDVDSSMLAPGLYTLTLQAERSGAPASIIRRTLEIRTGNTLDIDTDNDGIADSNDVVAGELGGSNFLQTVFHPNLYLMKTLPGLVLQLGATANAANKFSSEVLESDIAQYGDGQGRPVANVSDDAGVNVSGVFDFEIANLPQAGATVPVVLAQRNPIPADSTYRKFFPATGWQDFVEDSNNRIRSALGSLGECPAPGDDQYTDGLTPGHFCIELMLEDGGPNDFDGLSNGVIRDPGGVIQKATANVSTPDTETPAPIITGGGVGWLFIGLLGLGSIRRWNVCVNYQR